MKTLLLASALLITAACTTYPHDDGRSNYNEIISKHSAGDKQFAGLYHNFEFRATILNEQVSKAIHNRMKRFYAWNEEESQSKLSKMMQEAQTSTKVWLSFFTAERKNDNLANKQSIWKVYLYVNNQRYEGAAQKANNNIEEAMGLFPYHSRWATPYYVKFPVPAREMDGAELKLVITGPMGRRDVNFP